MADLVHDFGGCPHVRRSPREQLIEHGARGVDIAAVIDDAPHVLFGRHVLGRTHDQPALRLGSRAELRDAEVGDLDKAVARHQQVGWLDVPVHHALAMRVGEAPKDLLHRADGVFQVQFRSLLDVLIQRAAVDVLHRYVGAGRILIVVVEDRDNRGVIETGDCARFVAEARGQLLRRDVVVPVQAHDLQGHHALERRIERAIDRAHATCGEGIHDIVLANCPRDRHRKLKSVC